MVGELTAMIQNIYIISWKLIYQKQRYVLMKILGAEKPEDVQYREFLTTHTVSI